jgi:hypothetical protein
MRKVWRACVAVFCILTAALAVVLFLAANFHRNVNLALLERGITADAIVTQTADILDGKPRAVLVRYTTIGGQEIETRLVRDQSGSKFFAAGDRLRIVYLADRPKMVAVERFDQQLASQYVMFGVAVLLLVPCLVWIVRAHRAMRRRQALPRVGQHTLPTPSRWSWRELGTPAGIAVLVVFAAKLMAVAQVSAPMGLPISPADHVAIATVEEKLFDQGSDMQVRRVMVRYELQVGSRRDDQPLKTGAPIRAEVLIPTTVFEGLAVGDPVFIRYSPSSPHQVAYGLKPEGDANLALIALTLGVVALVAAAFRRRHHWFAPNGQAQGQLRASLLVLGMLAVVMFATMAGWRQLQWEIGMTFNKRVVPGEIIGSRMIGNQPYVKYQFTDRDGHTYQRVRDLLASEIESPKEMAVGRKINVVYIAGAPIYNRPEWVEEQLALHRKMAVVLLIAMFFASVLGALICFDGMRGRFGPTGGQPSV